MKIIISIAAVVLSIAFFSSCSSHLKMTTSQEATMSKEAVEILKNLKVSRHPFGKVSDAEIVKMRNQFAESERAQLKDMQKRFNPTITDTLINGVQVYIITPQNIKPENKGRLMLYIHGGGFPHRPEQRRNTIQMLSVI